MVTMKADYLAGSPFARSVVDTYGMMVALADAERIAGEHGTTIALLASGGLVHSRGHVNAVDLAAHLGY